MATASQPKRIAITIGDAAGIGPEVILKALRTPLPSGAVPIVFGALDVLQTTDDRLADLGGEESIAHRFETNWRDVDAGGIGICDVSTEDLSNLKPGQADPRAARLQLAAFETALDAADRGDVAAVCTAPWNKSLFETIDLPVVGHTDILAERYPDSNAVMMLAGPRLRVALVTTHIPIGEVPAAITPDMLGRVIETTLRDLRRLWGIESPRIAVCGLNPHAGEKGNMGAEEIEVIEPALDDIRRRMKDDVSIEGPFPSDTLFARFSGEGAPYDAVICMYHDQGLIPLKTLHFGESANITLGVPVIRTSVDHGTAYDIAGEGIADAGSMRYAIEEAVTFVDGS